LKILAVGKFGMKPQDCKSCGTAETLAHAMLGFRIENFSTCNAGTLNAKLKF
jgi:hypothetical protein